MKDSRSPIRIIGSGPGDPDLLTVKALRYLKEADVVYHDTLVHDLILSLSKPSCRKVCVGHRAGKKGPTPNEIARRMAEDYERSLRVVRLKAGDPFIFARLVEEIRALRERGVPFETVPGVTSALAVPESAGIPLTARGVVAGFTVECGTHVDGASAVKICYEAAKSLTRIFLMPGPDVGRVINFLYRQGYSPNTPAALIGWGTTPRQIALYGCLRDVHRRQREIPLNYPRLLVVGLSVAWKLKNPIGGLKPFRGRVVIPWLHGLGCPPWRHWWRKGFEPVLWIPGRVATEERSYEKLLEFVKAGRDIGLRIKTLLTARLFIHGLRHLSIDIRHLNGIPIYAIGRARAYLKSHGIVSVSPPRKPGNRIVLTLVSPAEPPPEDLRMDVYLPIVRTVLNQSIPSWPDAEWIDGRFSGLVRLTRNLIDPGVLDKVRLLAPRYLHFITERTRVESSSPGGVPPVTDRQT